MSRAAIRAAVSLREALIDPNLLGNVLVGESWTTWRALLLACMGERLTADELSIFQRVTGDRTHAPPSRIEEAAFISAGAAARIGRHPYSPATWPRWWIGPRCWCGVSADWCSALVPTSARPRFSSTIFRAASTIRR